MSQSLPSYIFSLNLILKTYRSYSDYFTFSSYSSAVIFISSSSFWSWAVFYKYSSWTFVMSGIRSGGSGPC